LEELILLCYTFNRDRKQQKNRETKRNSQLSTKMFFSFLVFREARHGTIEPDGLPSSSSSLIPKAAPRSSFRTYITTWDFSDRPATLRRLACILAFVLHVPLNIMSIVSWGISIWIFVGIMLNALNLVCVGISLWRLDIMGGDRIICGRL
jgi:hypothetical protein